MQRRYLQSLAALAALAPALPAQSPTALLREGDPLSGTFAGQTVTGFNVVGINTIGGFAATLTSDGSLGTLSQAWGSPSGAPSDVLLSELSVGTLVQTSWESLSFGVSDAGEISYSASGTGGPVGGFDSIWVDATPIAVEGDPIPTLPGQFWRFGSRPKGLADGTPVFIGGITSTSGGGTENRVLVRGTTIDLMGGDAVPGLPAPLAANGAGMSFDFQYSPMGTHYLVEVDLEGLTSGDNSALVMNGSALIIAGSAVREGTTVPPAAGGIASENWDNFDEVDVTESGHFMFVGDTDGDTATDEILVVDGQIQYREGDTVGGFTVLGSIQGAALNEVGDVVYIWEVDMGGSNVEALFVNDTCLIKVGDPVDWDGDGTVDPGFLLDDFEGTSQIEITADGAVYFIGDVDTGGGVLAEAFLCIRPDGLGTNYCVANVNDTGGPALISATGSASVMASDLVLRCGPVAAGQPGIFFSSDTQAANPSGIPFGEGNRCVVGLIVRLLPPVFPNPNGFLERPVNTAGMGIVAGQTLNFQGWYRDTQDNNGDGTASGFNLSDALTLTFIP